MQGTHEAGASRARACALLLDAYCFWMRAASQAH